ncbi:MAG: DUF5615 family PIN-like protein [Chloroflexota bacterium]|nr:DUF5615 family PIN-like protein [Chloroflexota bacterium]MDQ5864941.1 DUF5615 family PIN-like protein [Chloroflexota bacterium]
MRRFLLDENVNPAIRTQLARLAPEVSVWIVGDPGSVPLGTPDPVILDWCEDHDVMLVTNNRHSMPQHLRDHLAQGRHMPGIILLTATLDVGDVLDGLMLISGASLPGEYQDSYIYLSYILGKAPS